MFEKLHFPFKVLLPKSCFRKLWLSFSSHGRPILLFPVCWYWQHKPRLQSAELGLCVNHRDSGTTGGNLTDVSEFFIFPYVFFQSNCKELSFFKAVQILDAFLGWSIKIVHFRAGCCKPRNHSPPTSAHYMLSKTVIFIITEITEK